MSGEPTAKPSPARPVLHYPDLILVFLRGLLLAPLSDILKAEEAAVTLGPASGLPSPPLRSAPLTHLGCLPLLGLNYLGLLGGIGLAGLGLLLSL